MVIFHKMLVHAIIELAGVVGLISVVLKPDWEVVIVEPVFQNLSEASIDLERE